MSPVDLVWDNAKGRTKTNERVKFTFKHALARLSFDIDITANQKLEENGAVIKVKEVKLYGAEENKGIFIMAGYLNLENGAWTPKDNGTKWFYTWTPDGKVDGKDETLEEQQKKGPIYKLSVPPQLDYKTTSVTNDKDSYIFIIPQSKPANFKLKIIYTVQQGNFEEEVKVYKDLLKVPGVSDPSFTFEGGKAYVFHFKLSLDPVNFDVQATVGNWIGNEVKDEITIQ